MVDASAAVHEILFEDAYERLLPEFQSLPDDELVGINLDIAATVSTVLSVTPRLTGLIARIAEELPEFALSLVSKLEQYAMALSHAHTRFSLTSQRSDALRPVLEEGRTLRATLLADAGALVQRGHLREARLKEIKGTRGHLNLAFDLQLLAALFRETFAHIAGKSGVQLEELLRAEQIAAGIVRGLGLREKGAAPLRAAADMRVRAFTLLTRAYDQVRRAVSYLRWREGDVQKIVPSLYGRAGRAGAGWLSASDARG